MKKYINASIDKAANLMGELQETSNRLVDSIIELADNYPAIQQTITKYDAQNVEYGESIADELPEQLEWAIKQLNDVIDSVNGISDYFLH